MIPAESRMSMEGFIPSLIATVSREGIPNVSYVSQVFFVDDTHVAVSHQFFNKTMRNVRENPHVELTTIDPQTFEQWVFTADHVRTETSGPVFDAMEMQLETIASMSGATGIFQLKAAEIFQVLAVTRTQLAR